MICTEIKYVDRGRSFSKLIVYSNGITILLLPFSVPSPPYRRLDTITLNRSLFCSNKIRSAVYSQQSLIFFIQEIPLLPTPLLTHNFTFYCKKNNFIFFVTYELSKILHFSFVNLSVGVMLPTEQPFLRTDREFSLYIIVSYYYILQGK